MADFHSKLYDYSAISCCILLPRPQIYTKNWSFETRIPLLILALTKLKNHTFILLHLIYICMVFLYWLDYSRVGDVRLKRAQNEVDTYPFSHYIYVQYCTMGKQCNDLEAIIRFVALLSSSYYNHPLCSSSSEAYLRGWAEEIEERKGKWKERKERSTKISHLVENMKRKLPLRFLHHLR